MPTLMPTIKDIIDVVKKISTLNLNNILLLFCSLTFILVVNIYFGNFLKIPMKLNLHEKSQYFLDYRLSGETQLTPYATKINEIVKGEDFAFVVINLKKTESLQNPLLQGRYLFVLGYDKQSKKIIDSRHRLKNPNNIVYDYNTSKIFFNRDWVDSKPTLELTEDYEENGGENVVSMFGNYWFAPYARLGITFLKDTDDLHATRFVIMLSKPAFDNVKNQAELINIIQKAKNDYIVGLSGF